MPGQIYPSGGSVYLKFTTRAFSTGIPTTLAGSPVVSIYKDDSLTQSTAGVTLTVDFDSVTGLNHVTIDTTADATFYANGHTFYLVITTGTVSSVSVVGEAVGNFDLAAAVVTSGNTLAVDSSGRVDVGKVLGTAVTLDANNVLNVSAKYWAGTAIAATSIPVATAAGAAGGLFIAGTNAATTVTTSFTTTFTGNLTGTVADLAAGNSVLSAVSNIAVTSAALNATSSSATYTTGTSTGGATNTYTLDGVFDSVAAVGNAIDIYYEFDLSATSGATAVGTTWDGYLAGAVNTIKVYAYNWGGSSWDQVGNITGIVGTMISAQEFDLTSSHTGTGGNLGKARIRFAATGLTTGTLKTDRILLGYAIVIVPPANFASLAITAAGGVTLADGVAHGGTPGSSTATLALQLINAKNPTGNSAVFAGLYGMNISCDATNGSALALYANGDGPYACGLDIESEGGQGILVSNVSPNGTGAAIVILSDNSPGIFLRASGGDGIHIATTAGHAITLLPNDGDGIHVAPTLSANPAATGISVVGAGTGAAMQIGDGSAGGSALAIMGGTNDDNNGIKIIAGTNGSGITIAGEGPGAGVAILGGTNAVGLIISGQGADNAGMEVVSVAGPGLRIYALGSSDAISLQPNTGLAIGSGGGKVSDLLPSAGALATLFTTDSTKVYADAVDGSVVKETAGNATVSGTIDANVVQIGGVTAGDDVEQTGTATTFFGRMRQLYNRFFPEGPSGEVVKNSGTHTIVTKDSTGAVATTQNFSDDGSGNETIGPAS